MESLQKEVTAIELLESVAKKNGWILKFNENFAHPFRLINPITRGMATFAFYDDALDYAGKFHT